jgi:O-antigen/teichoic acid export membrane protein
MDLTGALRLDRQIGKNAAFGLGEYLFIQVLQIAATPFLVHRLGLEQYGIWVLINSVVAMTDAMNFGLGNAALRFVSVYRGRGETASVIQVIRASVSTSILIAVLAGSVTYLGARFLVGSAFKVPEQLTTVATEACQLTSLLVAVRIVDLTLSAALRGYERYDLAALASMGIRGGTVLSAVILVQQNFGLGAMVVAGIMVSLTGVIAQGVLVHRLIGASPWIPVWKGVQLRDMAGFGVYAWFQSIGGLIFGQTDRIVVGTMLGVAALGTYGVCLQLAQQIHVLLSAMFSVLFPLTSRLRETGTPGSLFRGLGSLIALNAVIAAALAFPLIFFPQKILMLWMGHTFGAEAGSLLRLLAIAFLVLAVNVALHYVLLGAGDIKFVSLTNLCGGAASLAVTMVLVPLAGLNAAALGRLVYGGIVSLNYSRVTKVLR